VLVNPHVALIFVIPGITYTLRATGEAIIVRDAELLARMAVNGKTPDHALVVSTASVFSHCPKCMIRAGLWDPEKWPDTTKLPSFAETLIAHAKLTEPLEAVAAMLETGESRQTLLTGAGHDSGSRQSTIFTHSHRGRRSSASCAFRPKTRVEVKRPSAALATTILAAGR